MSAISAFGVNVTLLLGRVGVDPDTRFTPNQKQVTKFTLATTETIGKDNKITQWHNIEAWGWNAEYAQECIRKGDEVVVVGKTVYESWDGKDGNKVYRTKIVVEVVRKTVTRNKNSGNGSNQNQNSNQGRNNNQQQDPAYDNEYNQGPSGW